MSERFDVVVIGGGTAGMVTASGCARLGRRVALIEREKLGGDCLWTGCVPTKALVATARLAHQMRHAGAWGLPPHDPQITPRAVFDSMRETQRIAGVHDDPEKFRKLGIEVIEGVAALVSPSEVDVNGRRLAARDIVIATGSRTNVPAIDGITDSGYIDHDSFLRRDELPRSVLILGGGAIGVEFAQLLRRLGSAVTLVETGNDILPKEDADVVAAVRQMLREEAIEVHAGWSVVSVRDKVARIENENRELKELQAEEIFIASGRRGNIEHLGLEAIGVRTDGSYIAVDKYLQTSVPRIWACGDVHGGLQFTHVAAYEAVKLVRNMLFPGKAALRYDNVPWAIYTDPEVAHVGLTEAEARERDEGVKIYRAEMRNLDRAVVDRATAGFIKLIADRKGHILGAHAVCPNASTVIEEIVVARQKGITVSALAQRISSYPSLSDGVQKAAALYYQDLGNGWLGKVGRRIAAWSQ